MGTKKIKKSIYDGCCMVLTTKHAKSIAVAPPFLETLGATVLEYVFDTDLLGTFSGEIERKEDSLGCARKKCELAFGGFNEEVKFSIASEGSFGAHPLMPFFSSDYEILYFIDKKNDFHLHVSGVTEKTNYKMQKVFHFDELKRFAEEALFPSHALILRPDDRSRKDIIFKGIDSIHFLEEAFQVCLKHSKENSVFVETDMRAHYNPSRMEFIGELSKKLSKRLLSLCPCCFAPGWGMVGQENGLRCRECDSKTDLLAVEIFGCVKCDYKERKERSDGLREADPMYCIYCNP